MKEQQILKVYEAFYRKLKFTPNDFHRDLYHKINWNDTLIGIKGPRGAGKTTMVLQHIKESFSNLNEVLYLSLDNLTIQADDNLDSIVDYHYTRGGTHLFLDEVHKYNDWQTKIKNLNDDYPDMHIVYTGSSMLHIDAAQGDLSRRQIVYNLHPMSFREYLEYEGILNVSAISLEDLLNNHINIAIDITSQIKVLKHYNDYLVIGQYPFYKSVEEGYHDRLQSTVNQVLESDLPAIEKVSFTTIQMAKKMLGIIVEKVPNLLNMSDLYKSLNTTRDLGLRMLYALERAELINILTTEAKSYKKLPKPEKIYLGSTNLMAAISANNNIGTVRETFFASAFAHSGHNVLLPKAGDFLVDEKYTFEVGGKNKGFAQIAGIENSYIAIDDVEIGVGNKIPLWMLGLLESASK